MPSSRNSIIILCDGTSNSPLQFDRKEISPTNIVKFGNLLSKEMRYEIFYIEGVGVGSKLKQLSEGVSGTGLSTNIFRAYKFICSKYTGEEDIYLFGFSRGAFTARSIAGLIMTIGIINKRKYSESILYKAFEKYRMTRPDEEISAETRHFIEENTYRNQVRIKFLGLWDTVSSLGFPIIGNNTFSWNRYHRVNNFFDNVEYCAQALALDENRIQFKPMILDKDDALTVNQKWFIGSHSNIGGGYANSELSDISLKWMINICKRPEVNLKFNENKFLEEVKPSALGEIRNSKKGFYKFFKDATRLNSNNENISKGSLHKSIFVRLHDPILTYSPKNINDTKVEEKTNVDFNNYSKLMINILKLILLAAVVLSAIVLFFLDSLYMNLLSSLVPFLKIIFILLIFLTITTIITVMLTMIGYFIFNQYSKYYEIKRKY